MERDEICKGCGGIGGAAGAVKQCGNCQGSGIQVNLYTPKDDFKRLFRQTKVRQLGPGMLQQIRASCDKVSKDIILPHNISFFSARVWENWWILICGVQNVVGRE